MCLGRSTLPLGSVVEDVQALATGRDDISHKVGAVCTDIPQAAAVGVQVGELLLHRSAGESTQRFVDLTLATMALWAAVKAHSVDWDVGHLLGRNLHLCTAGSTDRPFTEQAGGWPGKEGEFNSAATAHLASPQIGIKFLVLDVLLHLCFHQHTTHIDDLIDC